MEQCWVIAPDLFDLVQPLRGLLAAILPKSRRANLTLTRTDQGLDVLIEGIEADGLAAAEGLTAFRSEEHTSELQSLMRISYAVFCLKKKNITHTTSSDQSLILYSS